MFKRFKRKPPSESAVSLSSLPTDPETLQEMQRVIQAQQMDTWMRETMKEQRRSRRMRNLFRFGMLSVVVAASANTAYMLHSAGGSDSEMSTPHIAVVDITSQIDASASASATKVISGLRRAVENDSVSALVLNINSPGGSPTESQRIYHALNDLREQYDIPIVSWIGDMGASGAYYIAAGTDAIYASPSSIVGSIGVISASFGFTDAMASLGVERRVYTSGENKAFLDPFLPENADTSEQFSAVIGSVHQQFIGDVIEGRGEALAGVAYDDVRFSGSVWSGEQAVDMGLVDETIMLEQLFQRLLPSEGDFPSVRNYSVRENAVERLFNRLPGVVSNAINAPQSAGISMRY